MPGYVWIHPMEGSLDLRFEEGVKLLEERFQMREVIMQQVGVLILVVLGQLLVHAEGAERSAA
jgi:hypothetical protein